MTPQYSTVYSASSPDSFLSNSPTVSTRFHLVIPSENPVVVLGFPLKSLLVFHSRIVSTIFLQNSPGLLLYIMLRTFPRESSQDYFKDSFKILSGTLSGVAAGLLPGILLGTVSLISDSILLKIFPGILCSGILLGTPFLFHLFIPGFWDSFKDFFQAEFFHIFFQRYIQDFGFSPGVP